MRSPEMQHLFQRFIPQLLSLMAWMAKWNQTAEWIQPHGDHRPSWAAGSLLWTVLHHLCHIGGGQLAHDHPHQGELTSTDPHVLLSQTPGFHWSWLFTVGPKMSVSFVADWNKISYHWCATQLTFFILFLMSELFILSAGAYDCSVGICHPPLCTVVTSQRVCWVLVAVPYFTVPLFLW